MRRWLRDGFNLRGGPGVGRLREEEGEGEGDEPTRKHPDLVDGGECGQDKIQVRRNRGDSRCRGAHKAAAPRGGDCSSGGGLVAGKYESDDGGEDHIKGHFLREDTLEDRATPFPPQPTARRVELRDDWRAHNHARRIICVQPGH